LLAIIPTVNEPAAVGVPLTTQVELLTETPAGRLPVETAQSVMASPLMFKVEGVTDMALFNAADFPKEPE
jgi:hypothetical protein